MRRHRFLRSIPEEIIFCAALQLLLAAFAKESEPQNKRGCQAQIVQRQTEEVMKKHIAGLFGFALLLAAASVHAQITETIHVKVPFSFVAAGKAFPAADYNVQITQPTGLVKLSAANVPPAIMMSNTNEHPGREGGKSYMQFERYGDSWVLEQVAYDDTEQVLHRSKIEQRLAQLKPSGQQTLMASSTTGH
jgi:hypothetical protein